MVHGDAVFDAEKITRILSGDKLSEVLCQALKPEFCVFVTDVDGVFDKPPSLNKDAQVLKEIQVASDGSYDSPQTVINHQNGTNERVAIECF